MAKQNKREMNRVGKSKLLQLKGAFLLLLPLFLFPSINGQSYNKLVREGNREYKKGAFDRSEINYRQAVAEGDNPAKARFNLGDALYKMERFEEAGEQFGKFSDKEEAGQYVAEANYNLGNTLLKSGKIEESIEAYKRSLLSDPANHQAKYNLAKAKEMLQQQQDDNQQQNDQEQQQDDNQQQNDQEQQQDDNQQQNDQEQQQDDNQQQDDQDQQQNDQEQQQKDQQQQQPNQMKPEDAERLLQALSDREKEVQEKVKEEKARAARVRTLKNW